MNKSRRSPSNIRSSWCVPFNPSTRSSRSRASRSWISYVASAGNVCDTTAPPRVPKGRPFSRSSCVRSGGTRICARPASGSGCRSPTADLLRGPEVFFEQGRDRFQWSRCRNHGWPRPRKQCGHVNVDRKQVSDGVPVLELIHPPECSGPPRIGMIRRRLIERLRQRAYNTLVCALIRAAHPHRRHVAMPQLQNDLSQSSGFPPEIGRSGSHRYPAVFTQSL